MPASDDDSPYLDFDRKIREIAEEILADEKEAPSMTAQIKATDAASLLPPPSLTRAAVDAYFAPTSSAWSSPAGSITTPVPDFDYRALCASPNPNWTSLLQSSEDPFSGLVSALDMDTAVSSRRGHTLRRRTNYLPSSPRPLPAEGTDLDPDCLDVNQASDDVLTFLDWKSNCDPFVDVKLSEDRLGAFDLEAEFKRLEVADLRRSVASLMAHDDAQREKQRVGQRDWIQDQVKECYDAVLREDAEKWEQSLLRPPCEDLCPHCTVAKDDASDDDGFQSPGHTPPRIPVDGDCKEIYMDVAEVANARSLVDRTLLACYPTGHFGFEYQTWSHAD